MKKGALLLGLLACFAFAKAQDIDSLYQVFERGRGEAAYHAAVAIDESLRREPNFDADTASNTASNLDMATYLQNLAEVRLAEAGVADSLARALKLAEAVGFAQRSLDLSQRYADTPHKIVNRMTALSKATFQMGRTDEGLALMEQALGIAEENGDVFMEAVSHV